MTSCECYENKWFYMKYIGKYLSEEILYAKIQTINQTLGTWFCHLCPRYRRFDSSLDQGRPFLERGFAISLLTISHTETWLVIFLVSAFTCDARLNLSFTRKHPQIQLHVAYVKSCSVQNSLSHWDPHLLRIWYFNSQC
jgi:hypothetical protein